MPIQLIELLYALLKLIDRFLQSIPATDFIWIRLGTLRAKYTCTMFRFEV